MRSLHEDGGTNDADGRSASDMARLGQEPDRNDNLETRRQKLIRSTGSRNGRVSIHAINRIKRRSSENQRLLRRLNSDPARILQRGQSSVPTKTQRTAKSKHLLEAGCASFFEAFHLFKKKMPLVTSMVEEPQSRLHRCKSEIPSRRVDKNYKKYHTSFLSKKNLKNEQLSVLVGRSISSAIEDAEEASQLHSGNWDDISKADEWRKESHPNNNNTILSSTVRDFKKLIGVGRNKDTTLLVNYAPKLFHAIRSSQGIRTNSYVFSMCHKKLKPKIFGASASGSYFSKPMINDTF